MALNKMLWACPGLDEAVGERLYGDPSIGIPVQKTRFVRLHVNGGYYHYEMDLEHGDAEMMKRYVAPDEPLGDLFKGEGNAGPANLEGPYGSANEMILALNPDCPIWTLDDRYRWTYQRQTNTWIDSTVVRKMAETLNPLRDAAVASNDFVALRAWLKANFDYQKVLDYIAIRGWAEPWDDAYHNHFLYRRATDGRWMLIPQDKDLEFGEYLGWLGGKSFFIGEEGDPDNRVPAYEHVKDAFINAFRAELVARYVELDQSGVLAPATFKAKVDEAVATFSLPDYQASPAAAFACNFAAEIANLKSFADCRHQNVLALKNGTPPTCP